MQAQDIPYGYCHCGCGQRTNPAEQTRAARGWTKGEPKRYVARHAGRRQGPLHILDPETGCLVWQACVDPSGYGRVTSKVYAHRAAWEERHGPIPEGLHVHHRCKNQLCCNPDHMELLTRAEHARRHSAHLPKGRPPKFSEETVAEIRALITGGWGKRDVANAYGMDSSYAGKIAAGR